MAYVVEYAQSVHSAFRTPNSFCHDLQHVMRGAVKNLSQSVDHLQDGTERLLRYQAVFDALQAVIDTSTTMTSCTAEETDGATMMSSHGDLHSGGGSGADFASASHHGLSSSSYKSNHTSREELLRPFDEVGPDLLAGVLSPEQLEQLGAVYNKANVLQRQEADLRAAEAQVQKYTKHKKMSKLSAAEEERTRLDAHVRAGAAELQVDLGLCFPGVYKHILQQYIDLCNRLLRATYVKSEPPGANSSDAAADAARPAATAAVTDGAAAALTVEALEVHEAVEEAREHDEAADTHHDPEALHATASGGGHHAHFSVLAALQRAVEGNGSDSDEVVQGTNALHNPLYESTSANTHTGATSATSHTHAQVEHSAHHHDHHHDTAPPESRGDASTVAPAASSVEPAPESTPRQEAADNSAAPASTSTSSPSTTTESSPVPSTEGRPQSIAATAHSHFPFWFRYYYFDRLVHSTGRLLIAYGVYISFCKRLARKSGYTVPSAIKRHMDRVECDFNTARFDRHKRDFENVLQGIFTYRKNLELMATHVRLARDAEAHVAKYAARKNKTRVRKWQATLDAANAHIEQLRIDVFGRGAEEMVQFYEELIGCIQRFLSDFIVTLGGEPEQQHQPQSLPS